MISRKDREAKDKGQALPESWSKEVKSLLTRVYAHKCVEGFTFEVMGRVFSDEVCIAASFYHSRSPERIPVTYMASVDLCEVKDQGVMLGALVDSVGLFFDTVFATADWSDYTPEWTPTEFKGLNFYYTSSRENLTLTAIADDLLGEN